MKKVKPQSTFEKNISTGMGASLFILLFLGTLLGLIVNYILNIMGLSEFFIYYIIFLGIVFVIMSLYFSKRIHDGYKLTEYLFYDNKIEIVKKTRKETVYYKDVKRVKFDNDKNNIGTITLYFDEKIDKRRLRKRLYYIKNPEQWYNYILRKKGEIK